MHLMYQRILGRLFMGRIRLMLFLSLILGAAFSTRAIAQQIDVTPSLRNILAVSDGVPQFDISRGCKIDDAPSGLAVGLDESLKNCVRDEQHARDQLQSQWSTFAPSDRVMCTSETNDGYGVPPSYVELLTCLQDQLFAKTLKD
jgi:hypothetical protein